MKTELSPPSTAEEILALLRSYQAAAVLAAAAELDLFSAVATTPRTAPELARALNCEPRGLVILLDALVAIHLLEKSGSNYTMPTGFEAFLTSDGANSVLAMARHQANCLRRWAQLAEVVKTGRPAQRFVSVRGDQGDAESFIGAMHNLAAPQAGNIIQSVQPLAFRHLLDIGGGPGTWTIAFLHACPSAEATLFDLPHVLPMARERLEAAGLGARVRLVPGDFTTDPLPLGADLAWVSAIIHQNSRPQNRALFAKTMQALSPGGRIAIRDVLMEDDRTRPVAGALFAVNMLVATEGGGTFTFQELREDLESAGFHGVTKVREDDAMNSIVMARKPSFIAIAAMSQNRVIGAANKIPWHLSEDFKWFKQTTTGHVVVIGRKTFESIGKPLPNRTTVVLTRSQMSIPGVTVCPAFADIDPDAPGLAGRQIFICGGAQIYQQALPLCSELYLTLVKREVTGDAYFPPFENEFELFREVLDRPEFKILHYKRKVA